MNNSNKFPLILRISAAIVFTAPFLWYFCQFILLAQIRDFDDFWHLWAGRQILESGTVPRIDPVCFSSIGLDWINLNWLAQVIIYRTYLLSGLAGPAAIAALMVATVLLCHIYILQRSRVLILPGLLTLALLLYREHMSFSTRPQVYSFALLAVLNLILRFSGDIKRISLVTACGIVALLLVWNNLHGGSIFGYALIACDVLGSAIESRHNGGRWITGRGITLSVTALVGLSGFIFHPHGLDALRHMLFYGGTMQASFYERIAELRPLDVTTLSGMIFVLYCAAGLAIMFRTRNFSPYRETIFFLIFAGLTQTMRRFYTPLVIVTAPYVAIELSAIIAGLCSAKPLSRVSRAVNWFERLFDRSYNLLAASLAFVLVAWFVIFLPDRSPERQPGAIDSELINRQMYPVEIARYLTGRDGGEFGPNSRIFNDYNLGGYLGWVLYPQRRIFIDGRGDLHSEGSAYDDYITIIEARPGWEEKLDSLGVSYVVIPANIGLRDALIQSRRWTTAVDDPPFILLKRNIPPGHPSATPGAADL